MEDNTNKDGIDYGGIIERTGGRSRKLRAYTPGAEQPPEDAPIVQEQAAKPEPEETVKEKEPPREESRRRKPKTEQQDYKTLFIRTAPTTTRSGKAVYIRKEFHDRIMRIVQNIGLNEVSLFSYIDNVLEHHFTTYQDDISELYRNSIPEDIF